MASWRLLMCCALALAAVAWSCGGTTMCEGPGCLSGTGGGSSGTGGSTGGTDCMTACTAKAVDCGAPVNGTAQFCQPWCAKNPTDAQVSCLQASSCAALMGTAPCGVNPNGSGGGSGGQGGGSSGTGGGGGATGGAGGGSAFGCAGATCKSSGSCCSQAPYCSPDSSACTLQCKANGQSCFFDSECCNLGCDRNTDTCASCKPPGAACGNQNDNLPCCSGSCVNQKCSQCRGPGEICIVNADCCADSYCNSGKCFRRLRDGGIP